MTKKGKLVHQEAKEVVIDGVTHLIVMSVFVEVTDEDDENEKGSQA